MTDYNPISSPIVSIVLHSELTKQNASTFRSSSESSSNSGSGEASGDSASSEGIDFDVMVKNQFCQFERLEMEESVLNTFPTGVLIVRDITDVMSYIARKEIKSIIVTFDSGEIFKWYITSVSYINNAASEMDQAFIAIYFTNSIFKESQTKSFYEEKKLVFNQETGEYEAQGTQDLWLMDYPFVTTHKHIIQTYGIHPVFEKPLYPVKDAEGNEVTLNGCGVNLYIKNIEEPVNYVLFRPRVSDPQRREQLQSNIITYLNYIFTYAVNSKKQPYYLFWTDFSNSLNYKCFNLRNDLESGQFSFAKPNTDPGRIEIYGVYNSPDQSRELVVMGELLPCKKIYVAVTNPAYTINQKNYYYLRNNPVYLEEPFYKISGSTADPLHLMSSFMSESANTLLTTVTQWSATDSSGLTYDQKIQYSAAWDSNLVNLPDKGYWGFAGDFNQYNNKINTVDAISSYENFANHVDSTPIGLRDTVNKDGTLKKSPLYPFNDNRYVWQYQYDLTRTHPNIVMGSRTEIDEVSQEEVTYSEIQELDFYEEINSLLNDQQSADADDSSGIDTEIVSKLMDVNFNKVMDCKYRPMGAIGGTYDNFRRKQLEKTEKENFVAHVLCCMGKPIYSEESFFAKITGFVRDLRYVETEAVGVGGEVYGALSDGWLYSWKKLEVGEYIGGATGSTEPSIEAVASKYQLMQSWTDSQCVGSTGSPTGAVEGTDGFTGISSWAININERLNLKYVPKFSGQEASQEIDNYLGPGYYRPNITDNGNFAYRPIGYTGSNFNTSANPVGGANHIVKMYKLPINDIRDMGCLAPLENLEGQYLYYFAAENIVDGSCNG